MGQRRSYLGVLIAGVIGCGPTDTRLIVTVTSDVPRYERINVSVVTEADGVELVALDLDEGRPVAVPFSFTLFPARDLALPRVIRVAGDIDGDVHIGAFEGVQYEEGETSNIVIRLSGAAMGDADIDADADAPDTGPMPDAADTSVDSLAPDAGGDTQDADTLRPCEPGAAECRDEATLVRCNDAGMWEREECASGCDEMSSPPSCAGECAEGESVCVGDLLRTCAGDRWRDSICELGCRVFGRIAACERLVPSNLDASFAPRREATGTLSLASLHRDADDRDRLLVDVDDGTIRVDEAGVDDARITVRGSGALDREIGFQRVGPYSVFTVGDLIVGDDEKLWFVGSRPVIVVATGDVFISGLVYAGSRPAAGAFVPGPGGFDGGAPSTDPGVPSSSGEGMGGGSGGASVMGFDRGGAGGTFGTTGGNGGGSSEGSTSTHGSPAQIPLVGGSGGGAGGGVNGGAGGDGGGALQLSGFGSLIISDGANVFSSGGGGRGGTRGENGGAGGGGGSGGALLLEAPLVRIAGTVGVPGGGGGAGWSCIGLECSGTVAAHGETFRDPNMPSTSSAAGGAGEGDGGSGGEGHGSFVTAGQDGARGVENAGGGGGGAGRIRINGREMSVSGTIIPNHPGVRSNGDILTAPR